MAALGVLLGTAAVSGLMIGSRAEVGIFVATVAGTLGLVWLAINLGALITRPWVRRAAAVANLRVE